MLAIVFMWLGRLFGPTPTHHWLTALPVDSPLDLVLLLVAAISAMVFHEAGHLLASLTLNFKVLGASFGPFHLQVIHGDWRLSVSRATFFTASVSAIPRTLDHWRAAMLIVVAGGPLTTLFTLLGAAALTPTSHSSSLFQLAFVQVSLLLFVLGLVPTHRYAPTPNDARLLIDLAFSTEGAREMELNVLLSQQVVAGIRPQDYPSQLVARLAAWRGRPESQLVFAQALVRWAIDSEDPKLADAWDLYALAIAERCSARLQNAALASSACLDIVFREDPKSARDKLERVDLSVLFPKCFEQRACAAYQIALGHPFRAGRHIIRAQYAIPRGIPSYSTEHSLIEKLHMKALLASFPAAPQKSKSASVSV